MGVRSFFVSALFLFFQSTVPTPTSVQRDAPAVSVMSQMAAATGWDGSRVPGDAVATGTVTRYQGGAQEVLTVVLKAKGSRLYRTEVQDPTGQITTILNGDGAAVVTATGPRILPIHAAIGLRPVAFPFFGGVLSFAESSCTVQYLGIETIGTESAHRIAISDQSSTSDPAALLRARLNPLTVWVSATSFLPLQIQYTRISSDDPSASRLITRKFSDYRTVGGLALPFHQEEFDSLQQRLTLQLASVSINTGLSDAEFALPSAQE